MNSSHDDFELVDEDSPSEIDIPAEMDSIKSFLSTQDSNRPNQTKRKTQTGFIPKTKAEIDGLGKIELAEYKVALSKHKLWQEQKKLKEVLAQNTRASQGKRNARQRLVGEMVLDAWISASKYGLSESLLMDELDRYLSQDRDRALFDLPPKNRES
jgi:hypothetical protein